MWPLFLVGVATAIVSITGCAGGEGVERPPTRTVAPTAAPANTPSGAQPTPRPTLPAAPGDPAKGQQLFTSLACVGCHSTGPTQIVGPGLAGIKDRAATRVSGMSGPAYIDQSIREPNAHVVEGFPANVMPATFGDLSAADMRDLIAYLESL